MTAYRGKDDPLIATGAVKSVSEAGFQKAITEKLCSPLKVDPKNFGTWTQTLESCADKVGITGKFSSVTEAIGAVLKAIPEYDANKEQPK